MPRYIGGQLLPSYQPRDVADLWSGIGTELMQGFGAEGARRRGMRAAQLAQLGASTLDVSGMLAPPKQGGLPAEAVAARAIMERTAAAQQAIGADLSTRPDTGPGSMDLFGNVTSPVSPTTLAEARQRKIAALGPVGSFRETLGAMAAGGGAPPGAKGSLAAMAQRLGLADIPEFQAPQATREAVAAEYLRGNTKFLDEMMKQREEYGLKAGLQSQQENLGLMIEASKGFRDSLKQYDDQIDNLQQKMGSAIPAVRAALQQRVAQLVRDRAQFIQDNPYRKGMAAMAPALKGDYERRFFGALSAPGALPSPVEDASARIVKQFNTPMARQFARAALDAWEQGVPQATRDAFHAGDPGVVKEAVDTANRAAIPAEIGPGGTANYGQLFPPPLTERAREYFPWLGSVVGGGVEAGEHAAGALAEAAPKYFGGEGPVAAMGEALTPSYPMGAAEDLRGQSNAKRMMIQSMPIEQLRQLMATTHDQEEWRMAAEDLRSRDTESAITEYELIRQTAQGNAESRLRARAELARRRQAAQQSPTSMRIPR